MAAKARVPLHHFGASFYARVAALSFALGGCMELFMIKSGFYKTATELEGQRRSGNAPPPLVQLGVPARIDPWAGR